MGDHGVDNPVLDSLFGAQEEVTFHVARDLLLGLAALGRFGFGESLVRAALLRCLDLVGRMRC